MAYPHSTVVRAGVQTPPVVPQLQAVFAKLNDEALLAALIGPTRRGPKGHPVQSLWRCFIAKYVLGLPSTAALIRTLHNNPFIAETCGLPSPDLIPSEATFSRFFARLSSLKCKRLVKDVSRDLVRRCYETLPGFGKRVALDSSVVKAWSNGARTVKADQEAGWTVKDGSNGVKEVTYGYKLHLLVDAEYELPIAANISPGNVHDQARASYVLREARFTTSKFHPAFLMADQGYSGMPLQRLLIRQYRTTPISQINKSHKRLKEKVKDLESSAEWKALYKQRQSVERVFARLKTQRSLNRITVRRLMKVRTHCYLSLLALQAVRLCGSQGRRSLLGQAALDEVPHGPFDGAHNSPSIVRHVT